MCRPGSAGCVPTDPYASRRFRPIDSGRGAPRRAARGDERPTAMKRWRRDAGVIGTMVLLACVLLLAPGCGAAVQPAGPAIASPGAAATSASLGVVALQDGRVSGVESGGVSAY